VIFRTGIKDSCFCTTDGNVYILKNIVQQEKRMLEKMLVCNKFQEVNDFYTYPLPSSRLGIVIVSKIDDEKFAVPLENVYVKCWLMPYFDDDFFFMCFFSPHNTIVLIIKFLGYVIFSI